MAYAKFKPRRGTLYDWSLTNPILEESEMVVEVPDSGIGTGLCKFKIGDGVTPYLSLPYAFDGAAASSIDGGTPTGFSIIQLRRATASVWSAVNPVLNEGEPGLDTTNKSIKFGDGIHKWSELSFMKSSDFVSNIFDFGDEDSVSVSAAEAVVENNSYPQNALPDGWDSNINTADAGVRNLGSLDSLNIETRSIPNLINPEQANTTINTEYADTDEETVEDYSEDTETEEVTDYEEPVDDESEETPVITQEEK